MCHKSTAISLDDTISMLCTREIILIRKLELELFVFLVLYFPCSNFDQNALFLFYFLLCCLIFNINIILSHPIPPLSFSLFILYIYILMSYLNRYSVRKMLLIMNFYPPCRLFASISDLLITVFLYQLKQNLSKHVVDIGYLLLMMCKDAEIQYPAFLLPLLNAIPLLLMYLCAF